MLNRLYPLRKCEHLPKKECLYYHIHECLGYCIKEVDPKTIFEMTEEITKFLNGNNKDIINKIKIEMENASEKLNFERALELKNMLDDINITLTKQKIDLKKNYNLDLFAFVKEENYLSITIFFIRDGLLFGRSHELLSSFGDASEDLLRYIINFYEKNLKPKEILVPKEIDKDLLSEYLTVKVNTPQRGDLKKLLDLATENATISLKEEIEKEKRDDDLKQKALKELSRLLGKDISVMESFDNSHLFGTYYVGAMVVYQDFIPLKNRWRKYKIKSEAKDDLGAMREVIYRRYFKAIMENDYLPDLIVMDGGETQVSVAKEVLASLNLSIKIIGLKKDNHHKTSLIIDENLNTLEVSKDSPLFIYLAKIQEEVHRFAITYHRNLRSQGLFASYLDMVEGIGEVRKKELLKKYGSLKKIKEASLTSLEEILPKDVAKNLYDVLQNDEGEKNEE